MNLLEGLLELVAPTRCAGCDMPGSLLCDRCDERLPRIEAAHACPRCGAPWGHLICTECWSTAFAFSSAVALGEFEGELARAIVLHKDGGERRLGAVLGTLLANAIRHAEEHADVVTWIPPTDAALRRRGFDHGLSLAEPVARALGVPHEPLLDRARARDQRLLGRAQRQASAAGTFGATAAVQGRVLIVDDVMTTGSTLDAAANALLEAGARDVIAAVVARVW